MRLPSRLIAIAVPFLVSQVAACSAADDSNDAPVTGSDGDGGSLGSESGANVNGSPDGGPAAPVFGFRADWYDVFSDLELTRVEPTVAVTNSETMSPAPGLRGVLYSVRWTAKLTTASPGEHAFFTTADDGVRVFVDDEPIIDDWSSHPPKESTGKATLAPGEHRLRVEYFQIRGGASLALEWQPPGGARGAIPDALVVPLADPPADDKGNALAGPRPSFVNPVVGFDCPDPGVVGITTGAHPLFAMVCTGGKLPVRLSDDLVSWRNGTGAILPAGKAPWSANGGRNWAPEIHRVGASYVAYYTAVNGADVLSIGCASAPAPDGPYTDCGAPLVQDPLGVIDATFFEDTSGKKFLYYKIDGNSVGKRTPIFARELASNGLSFAAGSAPVEVLNNDSSTWEGGVVEAPWVIKHGTDYFLFYSGNVYDDRYRTGVARAKSPTGPFTKKGAPILGNNASWVGPGHGSVISVHGRDYFFHHAWPALANGKNDGAKGRFGLLAPIAWAADGWPVLGTGSSITTPMLWP